MVVAHELWFIHGRVPKSDWSFATEPKTLAYLAVALGITVAVRLLSRVRDGLDVPAIAVIAPYILFALRLHVGVSLIGLLAGGTYLAPNLELPHSFSGWLLGILMAVTGVSLLAGWRARWGAALLLVSGPVGMVVFGVWPVVQRLDLLGLALFLLVTGPGRWSADYEQGRERDPAFAEAAVGIWALRLCVGGALIAVAFEEKLANPVLGVEFLHQRLHDTGVNFNVAQLVGIPMSDLEFIRLAGGIEVLFGLLLISGALPQAIVLIAGVPFNLTLYFFGTSELLGHLPVYGAMLALLVYGSSPVLRPPCSRLLPLESLREVRRRRSPAPAAAPG